MRVTNFRTLTTERSNMFLATTMAGQIVKTSKDLDSPEVGVFVPKLLSVVDTSKGPVSKELPLKSTKIINEDGYIPATNKKITISNYLQLPVKKLWNMSTPMLIAGEHVTLNMIDQDINSLSVDPYDIDEIKSRPVDTLDFYVPAFGDVAKAMQAAQGKTMTLDGTNSYFLRLDSAGKRINLHMSSSNGETSDIDLTMDGAKGVASLTDGEREITIDKTSDSIYMKNKAKSTLTLIDKIIDMKCEEFYFEATTSAEFTSPDVTINYDNITQTTDKYVGTVNSIDLTNKTTKIKSDNVETVVKQEWNHKCPVNILDGLLTVTGWMNPGGIGFGAAKGKAPDPKLPQISAKGEANFLGPTGDTLVKNMPLSSLLTTIATTLDRILIVPAVNGVPTNPVPGEFTSIVSSGTANMSTTKAKG